MLRQKVTQILQVKHSFSLWVSLKMKNYCSDRNLKNVNLPDNIYYSNSTIGVNYVNYFNNVYTNHVNKLYYNLMN